MSETIVAEKRDQVLVLTINRPKRKNAITEAMYTTLTQEIEAAAATGLRAIVLTGAGADFSAGNDLEDFLENPPKDTSSPVFRFILAVRNSSIPVVAAVEGLAIGIGTTILQHCDLVYAAEDTKFKMPFVDLGVAPEAGSSLLIPAVMGMQRASELLLLCPVFGVDDARDAGLVTRVVPSGGALEAALKAAQMLAAKPPAALRRARQLIRHKDQSFEGRIAVEAEAFAEGLASEEFKEAVTAFQEKRRPDFSRFS